MGIVLFGLRRWMLPFGMLTLVLLINTALLSLLHDQYVMLPSAAFAGLLSYLVAPPAAPIEHREPQPIR